MTTPQLLADLMRDEGLRLTAYLDSRGFLTVGYGHAGDVVPGETITQDDADQILAEDVAEAEQHLTQHLPWWKMLDDIRQDVLVEMAFNLGIGGLLGFHSMLAAVQAQDWPRAASEMLISKWANQVGKRATRLAAMMKTGAR